MGALSDLMGVPSGSSNGSGSSGQSTYKRAKNLVSSMRGAKSDNQSDDASPSGDSYHSGGRVKRTGKARLKKGEVVLNKGQQKRVEDGLKRTKKGRGKRRSSGKSRG